MDFIEPKDAIARCASDPTELRRIEPALFELVVAELLAGYGWKVSVKPLTRDGGYGILGVTIDPSGMQTSWLIECKRYARDHKVGIDVANQILGVKFHLGIPEAVLVTTSGFTSEVRELSSARQDLHLIDFKTLTEWLRDYLPLADSSHAVSQAFESCFVSPSSSDGEFAQKLVARLREEGVQVWYSPEDILPGDKIYDQIKKAIVSFDRLIVILSSSSMTSSWVETELALALARERREGTRVLFPVGLVSIDEIRRWECIDSDSGVDIAREVRSYYIPDFSDWINEKIFNQQVAKVVEALKDQQPAGAVLKAAPNPVPAGDGLGGTTIMWSTEDGLTGQVYVSKDNGPEQLFAHGARGAQLADWIQDHSVYEFRLYAGKERGKLLKRLTVNRNSH